MRLKHYITTTFSNSMTATFRAELEGIENELRTVCVYPFFRTIDDFKGLRQESLVLQKGTGYSMIYRSWAMLKGGLRFLEGVQKIELKNIAELYEIWCFLEMKNIIEELLQSAPDHVEIVPMHIDDFIFRLDKGVRSRISFYQNKKDFVDLFYDYTYSTSKLTGTKSYTINQRPDIVLNVTKNDLKDNYVFTYLYDAKYRLASDERDGEPDIPPDDAINQMHRYRDAIYYVDEQRQKPEKEIIGGYILFPGDGDLHSITEKPFYKSIDEVNIGAFPLRPNDLENRVLIQEHLKSILNLDSETILKEVSPHKATAYKSTNPYVLIGITSPEQYKHCFEDIEHPFYYTGAKKPTKFGFGSLKYFAPYHVGHGINEYFEIVDLQLIPRNEIFQTGHPLFKAGLDERLLIKLGRRVVMDNESYFKLSDGSIRTYRYARLSSLRTANSGVIVAMHAQNQ